MGDPLDNTPEPTATPQDAAGTELGGTGPGDARQTPTGKHNSDYAIEEYRILQQTIADWGKQIFTIRGWILTVIAGLTVAHLSDKIPPIPFLAVSVLATLPLALCELFEGAWQRKAINRVRDIELALRGEREYDGPKINASLSTSATFMDAIYEFPKPLTSAFYVGLFIAVGAISLFSTFSNDRVQDDVPKTVPVVSNELPSETGAQPQPSKENLTTSRIVTPTRKDFPEQSHAPESANEPVVNGESSPPTR